jgi:tetratricopeptide (TPR) repeat protein
MTTAPPEIFLAAQAAQRDGRLQAAREGYEATIAAYPQAAPAYHNLAIVLGDLGEWARYEAVLRAALSHWPREPKFQLNLALSRLAEGDYAAGLPLFEARRGAVEGQVPTPAFDYPEWMGGPVGSLLIAPEQGLGDQIQFARYAPLLKARGIEVALACSPALARLFEPLGVRVVSRRDPPPRMEAWTLMGSLPLRMGTRLDSVPPPIPIEAWPKTRRGIGVAVRGNPSHPNDANRSLSAAAAQALTALPGAVSLAVEDTGVRDMQETAELVAGLDLVISVDTAVAHLAASMGKPTWVLLSAIKTDWRWGREGGTTPWYPSARLFRQSAPGDWMRVIDEVKRALG